MLSMPLRSSVTLSTLLWARWTGCRQSSDCASEIPGPRASVDTQTIIAVIILMPLLRRVSAVQSPRVVGTHVSLRNPRARPDDAAVEPNPLDRDEERRRPALVTGDRPRQRPWVVEARYRRDQVRRGLAGKGPVEADRRHVGGGAGPPAVVVGRPEMVNRVASHLEVDGGQRQHESRAEKNSQGRGRHRPHWPSTTNRTAPSVRCPSADRTFHRAR